MKEMYKVAIIDDDKIECFGDPLGEKRHSEFLFEYIENHYKNHAVFSKLNDKIAPEQLACFLVYLENKAIVLNETRLDKDGRAKYGTMAVVILPNDITGGILSNLLNANLKGFHDVILEKVHLSNDKILEDNPIFDYDNLPVEERIIELAKDSVKKR